MSPSQTLQKAPFPQHAVHWAGSARWLMGAVFALVAIVVPASAQYKVLFVGNSFTIGERSDGNAANDATVPQIFEALALAAGQPAPLVGMSAVGGRDFQYHAGMTSHNFQGTLDAFESQPWTHIVLQNHSYDPTHIVDGEHSIADHLDYGGALYLVAMDLSPKPTVVLFETWARAAASSVYTSTSTSTTFVDPAEFQTETRFNYRRLADLLNYNPANATNPRVRISPVGTTWEIAGAHLPAGDPDFINLFASDLHHGNDSGYYLAAAVIYARVYGASPVGLHASPFITNLNQSLPAAAFLEQVAWAVVSSNTDPLASWLIDFGTDGVQTYFGASPDDSVYRWNNVTQTIGTSPTGGVLNLVTAANAASNVDLFIEVPFAGANNIATTSSAVFPGNASGDTLFGHAGTFDGNPSVFPRFRISSLNPARVYTLTFYASRTSVSDNRETKYTVAGATSDVALLNAANNVNHVAAVWGIAPTPAGEITVSIDAGSNNSHSSLFTYIGALRIDEHESPVGAPGITSSSSAGGTFGSVFNYTITATGSPTSFGATGLPAGLSVNPATGSISGTPTAAGTFNATITATNSGGTDDAPLTITIAKATATVSLSNLSQAYNGSPRPVTATTAPGGLTVNVTYAGSPIAPTALGTYAIVATIADANHQGSASGTLSVGQGTATVTLGSLSQTYNGSPRPVTATTAPAGLTVNVTYAGSATAPTAAGSYAVVATVVDPNYLGGASGTLTVGKATGTLTLGGLSQAYTGTPRSITASTVPGGMSVDVTYAGGSTAPTAVGSYAVGATIIDTNYQGSASGTLTVSKATATVTLGGLSQGYNGMPRPVMVTTAPSGLTVNVTYSGSATAPTAVGSYVVVATVADVNFQGSASGNLTIGAGFALDQTGSLSVDAGDVTSLSVTTVGMTGATFQWQMQPSGGSWANVAAATGGTYVIPSTQRFHAGNYRVQVSFNGQTSASDIVTLVVQAPSASNSRLLNLSTRGLSPGGGEALIPGFVIGGSGLKRVLIRAVGPTLGVTPFNLSGVLPDPRMELKRFDSTTNQYVGVASNDDWATNSNAGAIVATAAQVFAFELTRPKDAALLVDLAPGQYSVVARDAGDAAGVTIVEVYDADPANTTSRLINISNRGFSGVGADVMIPGFVVSSEGPKTLLLRVVGPTLGAAPFNVPGTMSDPKLVIYQVDSLGQSAELLAQDNWGGNPDAAHTVQVAQEVGAFPLTPGSADAAFVVTLNPGTYSIHGTSASGTGTGAVLVEAYVVP